MDDLIRRLEAATAPDRELDADICRRLVDTRFGFDTAEDWPVYTASIDAALMLVPNHHLWQIKQSFECCAIVWMIEVDYDDKPAPTGYSTTYPALALCIAALKARQATLPPQDRHSPHIGTE